MRVRKPVARDRMAFAVLRSRMAHRNKISILGCPFVAAISLQHFTDLKQLALVGKLLRYQKACLVA